jgi:hypothetical protein
VLTERLISRLARSRLERLSDGPWRTAQGLLENRRAASAASEPVTQVRS